MPSVQRGPLHPTSPDAVRRARSMARDREEMAARRGALPLSAGSGLLARHGPENVDRLAIAESDVHADRVRTPQYRLQRARVFTSIFYWLHPFCFIKLSQGTPLTVPRTLAPSARGDLIICLIQLVIYSYTVWLFVRDRGGVAPGGVPKALHGHRLRTACDAAAAPRGPDYGGPPACGRPSRGAAPREVAPIAGRAGPGTRTSSPARDEVRKPHAPGPHP